MTTTARDWPRIVETATDEEKQYALDRAINGLREEHPLQSASQAVYGWQKPVLITLLVIVVAFAIWQPMGTAVALIGLCTFGYVLTMVDREEGATEAFAAAGLPFRSLYKASEFLKG